MRSWLIHLPLPAAWPGQHSLKDSSPVCKPLDSKYENLSTKSMLKMIDIVYYVIISQQSPTYPQYCQYFFFQACMTAL